MLSVGALSLAAAVSCWPARRAARRLRMLRGKATRSRRVIPRPSRYVILVVSGVLAWLLAGPVVAVAAVLVTGTAQRRWHARRARERGLRAQAGVVEALASLVTELGAGAHPASAAEHVAREAEPNAAAAMRAIASAERLGGDVDHALARVVGTGGDGVLEGTIRRLGEAWRLAHRHGLPLAEVLDAVRGDVEHRTRYARQVKARMAGPRSSATVLALLPGIGVLLGQAMGAEPLGVLFGGGAGGVLLLMGAALSCAGVFWCARLTEGAVRV